MSGISARVSLLHFGTSSLSRLECATCKETTLHKLNACIHCGTAHQTQRAHKLDFNGKVDRRTPRS